MSLRLLLDEDSQSRHLVNLLTSAGHDVLTVNQARLAASNDRAIFEFANKKNRIILTSNCQDFLLLVEEYKQTRKKCPGLLLIYKDNNRDKDLSATQIIKAIGNVEAIGLQTQTVVLNHYKY